ncbi:MAG: rhomboid family intramembrane serine protease [Fuerstiella sp.]|nr:rhomboid family intramembrane serine protease [Fuerstiella sp.]
MGIDSREYLRDDGDVAFNGRGSVQPMSVVTKIILATVAVFVLQVVLKSQDGRSVLERWFILNGSELFGGQIWRLLSYAFLHDTGYLLHIGLNMYMLYVLGRATAQLTGNREFLWFYAVSAMFSGLCSVCFYRLLKVDPNILGASGAVYAVFTLFAMHYPRQKLYLFGLLGIEVRWLLLIYVAIEANPVIRQLADGELGRDGTAHSAHLGGLLFGWLYFRWNMRFSNWWDGVAGRASTRIRAGKSGLRVYNPKEQPESNLSDRVDAILAKISREGEQSLTDRERRILRQASEQMKKRR